MQQPLHGLIHEIIDPRKQWYVNLLVQWPTIIASLASRVRIEKMVGTTLVLGVYDTHWMHEIHALSRTILPRVQALTPAGAVTDIRCVWVHKKPKREVVDMQPHDAPVAQLTLAQQRFLPTIADGELREYFYRYLIRCNKKL